MKEDSKELTLGQKVRRIRLEQHLTQKELASDFITRNMLSQIENDIARPSIKTIEHIAKSLDMPIGYFVDPRRQKIPEVEMINEVMGYYDALDYEICIEKLDAYFGENPEMSHKPFLRNIYIDCCLLAAKNAKNIEDHNKCKVLYEKILAYESDLRFEEDAVLYNIYSELSEANAHVDTVKHSKYYEEKASIIVNKMVANQIIQSMYIAFVEGKYDLVIQKMSSLEMKDLDTYNKGRYFMMIGSAYYYKASFKEAIKYLEKAVPYYQMGTYNSIITMIYEDLSKCYSNLDDYKKAYEYLQMSKLR